MIELQCPWPKQEQENVTPFEWPVSAEVKLVRPSETSENSFNAVLNNRQTRRVFSLLNKDEVGELFYLSNRTLWRDSNSSGLTIEHRPVVSAGGLHAVECLVLSPDDDAWYRYDPFKHQLQCLDISGLDALARSARAFFPTAGEATIIWYLGDMTRLSGKYQHPESLLWRDAGAMIATHSLVSEHLGYAFCPLGITGGEEAKTLSDKRVLVGLGLALVGGRD